MDDTQDTIDAPIPDAIFTADDDLASLWFKAYQGEVSGETLFGLVAAGTEDPERRRKMELLTLLEKRTKEACQPALARHGFSSEPDAQTVKDAESLAEAVATIEWTDFLAAFEPITTQFVQLYKRIGEVDESDRDEVEMLVAHEHALGEFARRELAGSTDNSTELIEALPHLQPQPNMS